jgi:hypothetical protein
MIAVRQKGMLCGIGGVLAPSLQFTAKEYRELETWVVERTNVVVHSKRSGE